MLSWRNSSPNVILVEGVTGLTRGNGGAIEIGKDAPVSASKE